MEVRFCLSDCFGAVVGKEKMRYRLIFDVLP
jgi:hypothetical protein